MPLGTTASGAVNGPPVCANRRSRYDVGITRKLLKSAPGTRMSRESTTSTTASLELTREEAEMLLDGLQILLNSKRFAFKEPDENAQKIHADIFAAVARLEAFVASFGR